MFRFTQKLKAVKVALKNCGQVRNETQLVSLKVIKDGLGELGTSLQLDPFNSGLQQELKSASKQLRESYYEEMDLQQNLM